MGPVAKGNSEFSTDAYIKNNNKDPFKDQYPPIIFTLNILRYKAI